MVPQSIPSKTEPKQIGWVFIRLFIFLVLVMIVIALGSCTSEDSPAVSSMAQEASDSQEQTKSSTDPSDPTLTQAPPSDDPDTIQKLWEASAHADSFVVSDSGENNSCSSCHSRYNYIPAIDDIPEECFTCKFEVNDPDPYIDEKYWRHVDCMNCHRIDKKKVEPAIAWLEFALIEEYSEVGSVTALCDKCHLAGDVAGHASVIVGGDHPDYPCTKCHDAHDTTASCSAVGCHEDILAQDPVIPGHDEDHTQVACVACHDAGELEIGFVEDLELWTTFITTDDEGTEIKPFTSHTIVLEAPCDRCHFPENPWGFLETVEAQ